MLQINLNQAELWPKPIPFNARQMALTGLGLVLIAAALLGFLEYRIGAQQDALAAAKEKRQSAQARPPTVATKAELRRRSRGGRYWVAAFSVVSTTMGPDSPDARAASVAMRAAEISGLGDTRS